MFFLPGCIDKSKNEIFILSVEPAALTDKTYEDMSMPDNDAYDAEKEKGIKIWTSIGKRTRALSDIIGVDEPAILVNGHPITKKSIEHQKILSEEIPNVVSLKKSIISMVRMKVVQVEAIRKKVQPSQDKIDDYLKMNRDILENVPLGTESTIYYIEGLGMTKEEYLKELEESAYNIFQREALYDPIEESQKEKVWDEAEKRGVKVSVVSKEYYERYVNGLVRKAKIEILDPEIKDIFSDN